MSDFKRTVSRLWISTHCEMWICNITVPPFYGAINHSKLMQTKQKNAIITTAVQQRLMCVTCRKNTNVLESFECINYYFECVFNIRQYRPHIVPMWTVQCRDLHTDAGVWLPLYLQHVTFQILSSTIDTIYRRTTVFLKSAPPGLPLTQHLKIVPRSGNGSHSLVFVEFWFFHLHSLNSVHIYKCN